MVIAMALVWMMKMSIHQIVDMIPMRHRLMATTGTMNVLGIMPTTTMPLGTIRGIGRRYFDPMFFDSPRGGLML